MTVIDTQEMTPDVAKAIKKALAGEEILVSDEGKLYEIMTKVVPSKDQPVARKQLRKPGFAKGKIRMADDWDSKEVNDEIAREFGMLD